MKNENEYEKFDSTMRKLLTVSHSIIRAKLDAEKAEKSRSVMRCSMNHADF